MGVTNGNADDRDGGVVVMKTWDASEVGSVTSGHAALGHPAPLETADLYWLVEVPRPERPRPAPLLTATDQVFARLLLSVSRHMASERGPES